MIDLKGFYDLNASLLTFSPPCLEKLTFLTHKKILVRLFAF